MLKMAEPIIHHRNPEFQEILTRVNENLKYLFQTTQPVLTLTCSGTGGMEAIFLNLFSPGEKNNCCQWWKIWRTLGKTSASFWNRNN